MEKNLKNIYMYVCIYIYVVRAVASMRNPTRDKVMRQRSDGQGRVRSQVFPLVFPEHVPPKIRICLPYCIVLFYFSDTLWKKLIQGFNLLQKNVSA